MPAATTGTTGASRWPDLPTVTVAELNFDGDYLPSQDQQDLGASLKERTYAGDAGQVQEELVEKVRGAWLNRGYLQPQVDGDAMVLTRSPVNERIAVTIHVDKGQQYRLGRITFKNNKAFSNTKALRSLFPIKDGDIFSRENVAKGLENLRKGYLQFGYVNFTSVPDTQIDDVNQLIFLDIEVDEGKQFFISSLNVVGLDPSASQAVLADSLQKKGDVYNERLLILSLRKHASWLPPGASSDSRIRRQLDERAGTVAITFDFQPSSVEEQPSLDR